MCKQLLYDLINNDKYIWLSKRKKEWSYDKYDFYIFLIFVALPFGSIYFFQEKVFPIAMTLFIFGGFLGRIRNLKATPGDIESKLMYPLICISSIFGILIVLISIISWF